MACVIAIAALLLAQDLRGTGTIAGVVRDTLSKDGVRRAVVTLEMGGADGATATAIADGEGNFEFRDLPAGDFRLTPAKEGYAGSGQFSPKKARSQHLSLAAGQAKRDIVLELEPLAAISGRVLDSDGDPIANAYVSILQRASNAGKLNLNQRGSSETNAEGEFRIYRVPAGSEYVLQASAVGVARNGRRNEVNTFYPASYSADQAAPIELAAGEERTGYDIRMMETDLPKVRVRVVPPDGVEFPRPAAATLHVASEQMSASRPVSANAWLDAGEWSGSLGFGEYVFSATMTSPNGSHYGVSQRLRIEPGVEADITLQPRPAFDVTCQLELEGAPFDGAFQISASAGHSPIQCTARPGEMCVLRRITPDRWRIYAEGNQSDFHLKSMRMGDEEVASPLDLAAAPDRPLRIVMARTVSIEGQVERDESGEAPNATVAAIDKSRPESQVHIAQTDAAGAFALKGLQAGTYRVIALGEHESDYAKQAAMAKTLADHGEAVVLKPGDKRILTLKPVAKP